MSHEYLIGLDYGTQSARGVLIDVASGAIEASHTHPYRHGTLAAALPDGGTALPPGWALQCAPDYTEAAEAILGHLGRSRVIRGIGLGFTASSPLPTRADGTPLSTLHPQAPHAYVKLWKHQVAQPWADRINAHGGEFLANFGGKLSAEWLIAKAAQMADEAPDLWAETERFIEAGDWLVWQLTGHEVRSLGFAAYKAQYQPGIGYPSSLVGGLEAKLGTPVTIGEPAGRLSAGWRARTGIEGEATVAVAVIDSHVVMPAAGAVRSGTLVGALGTSAAFMLLDDARRPLPRGIEGVARDGVLPGFWCYEAGQAGFGDTLEWFIKGFLQSTDPDREFARLNALAADMRPGQTRMLSLDWWNGCRVPFGDSSLSGLLLGLSLKTTVVDVYRTLLESLCCGTRRIVDCLATDGAPVERIVLTSGLSGRNPLLMQLMADVLGRTVHVPLIDHATAVGAAIHGAVAAGVVPDFADGARRYGAREFVDYVPNAEAMHIYDGLYRQYVSVGTSSTVRDAMHALDIQREK
ncbi:FGGY-family carbohydrate kinase [Variovorax sp. ZS18.2.2]|uniref:FGGY-family carbohydrate kinase n=1 Tax=Variovorax sp. ZS18.2.2 TaxID=2971255 RepID=UPI00215184B7|nr:FGGY-family carbohydrate kinase [Variovorax sp. ZS18.2.2]MCR6479531.1 FGGY-family carbohydrate kinase [Variovorax sp. ZS18.2.2]